MQKRVRGLGGRNFETVAGSAGRIVETVGSDIVVDLVSIPPNCGSVGTIIIITPNKRGIDGQPNGLYTGLI